MDLTDRKKQILKVVVEDYIRTAEPVGSKAIAAEMGGSVSSATIRNELSDLVELGYLEQPHTSAGRIPTFNGYRLYIDKLMTTETLSEKERQRLDDMLEAQGALTEELLIQSAGTALAELTKCAAVVTNAAPKFSIISKVEVIPTGKRLYVILLITSNGSIKNKACRLEFDLSNEQLEFFTHYMEENLEGVSVEDLSEQRLQDLIAALGAYMTTLSPLVQGLYELSRDLKQKEVTVSGARNLLTCSELEKMDIVQFMEHTDTVIPLLDDAFSGVQVLFSQESNHFVIGNSSMIVSKYQKGNQPAGALGVIGPMRINYAKIIPYIEYFTQKLTDLISDEDEHEPGQH